MEAITCTHFVIPGARPQAASPESILPAAVVMDSGLAALRRLEMTAWYDSHFGNAVLVVHHLPAIVTAGDAAESRPELVRVERDNCTTLPLKPDYDGVSFNVRLRTEEGNDLF